jgi:hypothetical protein
MEFLCTFTHVPLLNPHKQATVDPSQAPKPVPSPSKQMKASSRNIFELPEGDTHVSKYSQGLELFPELQISNDGGYMKDDVKALQEYEKD